MDPHEKEELQQEKAEMAAQPPVTPTTVVTRAPEPPTELTLDPAQPVLSLLSAVRAYSLSRRELGVLPKDVAKQVDEDVIDEAFSQGLVAFTSLEEADGKAKGLVLTDKGYALLATQSDTESDPADMTP